MNSSPEQEPANIPFQVWTGELEPYILIPRVLYRKRIFLGDLELRGAVHHFTCSQLPHAANSSVQQRANMQNSGSSLHFLHNRQVAMNTLNSTTLYRQKPLVFLEYKYTKLINTPTGYSTSTLVHAKRVL